MGITVHVLPHSPASKREHGTGALVELSAELLRIGCTGVPLVYCEVGTHNSKPFSSYDFGRPSPDGLEHAPRAAAAERVDDGGAGVKCPCGGHAITACSSAQDYQWAS